MNQKQEGYLATLENYKHEAEIQRDKFLVSFSGVALGLSITLATTHKENNPALGLAVLLFTGAVTTITLSYATSILSQKRKMRLFLGKTPPKKLGRKSQRD